MDMGVDAPISDDVSSKLWDLIECRMPGNETCPDVSWTTALWSLVWLTVKTYYLENRYFAGGVGLMVIGFLFSSVSKYWKVILSCLTWQKAKVCVSIGTEEPAMSWVLDWLGDRFKKDFSTLTLKCRWEASDENNNAGLIDYSDKPKLFFLPQLQDPHPIYYRGKKIIFQLNKGKGPANANDDPAHHSSFLKDELLIMGPDKQVIYDLIEEAMEKEFNKNKETKRTVVLRWTAQDQYWQEITRKRIRPLESVILECDSDKLVKDAQQFFTSSKWYSDRGIPHRRGYLLYGPPGCGKTSLILAMAGEMNLDVAMLNLSAKEMSDDMLHSALSQCRPNSILVLEDVDSAFNQRMDGQEKFNNLTFSGLLNALDGISSQEDQIVVMTTNHIDKLDAALIRPGRVDFRLYLGLASKKQAERMFLRFYPEEKPEMAAEFSSKIPDGLLSPASIQGLFLNHRDDPNAALDQVSTLVNDTKNSEQERKQNAQNVPQSVTTSSDSGKETDSTSSVDEMLE